MPDDKKTNLSTGLTDADAASRLNQYGENVLPEKQSHPLLKLLSYFWGPIPWMIEAAADLVLTAPGVSVIIAGIAEARRIFHRMLSYATFRIAETIRVLLFMTLSILDL